MKSVYTTYKERLVEISGKSRSIYSRKGDTSFSCDLSKFFFNNDKLFEDFIRDVWKGNGKPFELINKESVISLFNYNRPFTLNENKNLNKEEMIEKRNREIKKIVSNNVNAFYKLKKEIIDIARETGRYELYIGYPFVEGNIGGDTNVKAPLVLFPVKINISDDSHVSIELVKDMPVTLNKALLFAYAKEKRINIDNMVMEFDDDFSKNFRNVNDVLKYLSKYHINFGVSQSSDLTSLESSGVPTKESNAIVTNHCVVGRYPLANSIYLDYSELENRKASSNEAIDELIYAKKPKSKNKKNVRELYTINKLDYTQEKAIERINNEGNMVIYGPPGTGKSQTIVNVISDALARKKRVLIISQKKAALDVVYNRLGNIRKRAMFISDPEKEKESFYKRCYDAHNEMEFCDCSDEYTKHYEIEKNILSNYEELRKIFDVLYKPCDFGIDLETMYEQSAGISKDSYDYEICGVLSRKKDILNIKYPQLSNSLSKIKQNNRDYLYYKYKNLKKKNPLIDHLKEGMDVYTVDSIMCKLDEIMKSTNLGFDTSRYPYSEYLIAHYVHNIDKENIDLDNLVSFVAKQNKKKGFIVKSTFEKELKENFTKALREIRKQVTNYEFFKNSLSKKGYNMVIAAILNGNLTMLKNLRYGLNNYNEITDIKLELSNLKENELKILEFAFLNSSNINQYSQIVNNFMPIRMYIELVKLEKDKKEDLAKIMNFNSLKEDILVLKRRQEDISKVIASNSFNNVYLNNYNSNKNSKDFLYQISKQQHSWPIRRFMKEYKDLMLDLYPCWLLSPENASTILPLVKDMFDIVLVDEASQVFIENTLPLMYRAKNVVIAGDNKQLRPSSTFMKRYMGSDFEEGGDPTLEATLEVESLLDLATSRLPSTNLNYHYRSKSQELIDFSNNYFYDGKLEIVPDIGGNKKNHAITRVKVDGRWINRRNEEEAKQTVFLIKKILASRKNNESIGVISFNSDQASAIEEELRRECKRDPKFAQFLLKEQNRFEGNEDVSLFVKNLENVQGDERDIIILSTGYARNESGRVLANFGSLSLEGGENRLNVAVTRAKSKTYVVTSIEPEELKVEDTKNEGPKVLKKYLSYVRAVSSGKKEETRVCLNAKKESMDIDIKDSNFIALEIKNALESLGYIVDVKVGNTKKKIDLAVYDRKLDKYLIGIECINKNYKNIDEMIENRIYHDGFLESRGWNIYHVWTRDWWNNKSKVVNSIVREIEKSKKDSEENKQSKVVSSIRR